eukprot:gene11057-biopygen287
MNVHRGCFALLVAVYVDREFPDPCQSFESVGVETAVPLVTPCFDDCGSQHKNSPFFTAKIAFQQLLLKPSIAEVYTAATQPRNRSTCWVLKHRPPALGIEAPGY